MDDYLGATLGYTRMCDINQTLYRLLGQTDTKDCALITKLKATLVHSVYHTQINTTASPSFVQDKAWPMVLSFNAQRIECHDDLVVPIPYKLTTKKMAEYSTSIMAFYTELCKIQTIPCEMDRLHLHNFGWLRHTNQKILLKAAANMTKGLLDTLRYKALKALNHIADLNLTSLINALAELDTTKLPPSVREPQRALSTKVLKQINLKLTELHESIEEWMRENEEYKVASVKDWNVMLMATSNEDILSLHQRLLPLVFGYMLYGDAKVFGNGKDFDEHHVTSLGFRRDHINIGFTPMDPIELNLELSDKATVQNPKDYTIVLSIHKLTKQSRHPTAICIDGGSTVGKAIILLRSIAKHVKASRLFFNLFWNSAAKDHLCIGPATLSMYKQMAKFFNIPAGMRGTTAARMTHAERDAKKFAAEVTAADGITADIMQRRDSSAANTMHTTQEHERYAARAQKRRKEDDEIACSDTEYEDIFDEEPWASAHNRDEVNGMS